MDDHGSMHDICVCFYGSFFHLEWEQKNFPGETEQETSGGDILCSGGNKVAGDEEATGNNKACSKAGG